MNWSNARVLHGKTSIFLDALRFVAAFTVFLAHGQATWYPEKELDILPSHLSHGAVVVFFVLSGFVIAHTTTNKKRDIKQYASARFSRLYSIFFPAIIITIICSIIVYLTNPGLWQEYDRGNTIFRYLISLIFCNEIWLFSSAPKINGPIWSLSYEFWYYVIFGCFFYKKHGIKGFLAPIVACLIAGPKILLMMLIWLTGWFVYHLPRPKIAAATAWVIVTILLLLSVFLMLYLPSIPAPVNSGKLFWADQFLTDWILGFFIGAALYFLPNGVPTTRQNNPIIVSFFRKLGDLTFPIYVLHFPLLVLAKSVMATTQSPIYNFFIGVTSVFILCFIIGMFLETKRVHWNRFFHVAIDKLSNSFI